MNKKKLELLLEVAYLEGFMQRARELPPDPDIIAALVQKGLVYKKGEK